MTDDVNRVTRENLTGLRVVRAYNAEKYQEQKFEGVNEELTGLHIFVKPLYGGHATGDVLNYEWAVFGNLLDWRVFDSSSGGAE